MTWTKAPNFTFMRRSWGPSLELAVLSLNIPSRHFISLNEMFVRVKLGPCSLVLSLCRFAPCGRPIWLTIKVEADDEPVSPINVQWMHEVFDRFPTTNLASHSDSAGKKRNMRRETGKPAETSKRHDKDFGSCSGCETTITPRAQITCCTEPEKMACMWLGEVCLCSRFGLVLVLCLDLPGSGQQTLLVGPVEPLVPFPLLYPYLKLFSLHDNESIFKWILSRSTNILYMSLPLFRSNYNPTARWMGLVHQLCAFCRVHLSPPQVK